MMNGNRVFNNVKWMVVCKTLQSLLQLIVGMLTARYLGPSDYGLINYAKSIVSFAIPFVQLGLDATLVKELIDHPEQEGKIMGTSLALGVASGFVWVALIGGFVSVFNANETRTILVCLLYSLSVVFQATTLIQYWYHSKLQAKYPSIMQLITYVVLSAYKIYLLAVGANVYWFALAYSIEFAMIGFSLLAIYRKGETQKLSFSFALARQLVARSHPYIWAALMVTVFQNTDHIMLKTMIGNEENGFYTAAITAVGVCQYVYVAIIDSMRPVIVEQKANNAKEYENSLSKLYGIIFYLALLQGIGFTVFADLIIRIMYGAEYMAAVPVVRILVWYVAFSFMGMIRNIWILAEEKQSCLWKINLTGIVINACANALLIPGYGASGAAIASLLTQFLMNFCLGFVYGPLKPNNRILIKGLNTGFLLKAFRKNSDVNG